MPKKIFKEKIVSVSSKKLEEIGQAVITSGSSFKKMFVYNNLVFLSFFFALLGLIITIVAHSYLPEKIPLFYTHPWGEEQLAQKNFFFIIPALSLAFSLINFYFAKFLIKKGEKFLPTMFGFFSFFLCFISIIAIIKIVFLMI